MTRDDAWRLLTEYTKSESLLKHAMAVEAAVRGYARKFGEDEEGWGITALLHDFDYERWPTLGEHPVKGSEILRANALSFIRFFTELASRSSTLLLGRTSAAAVTKPHSSSHANSVFSSRLSRVTPVISIAWDRIARIIQSG